jgi:putative hydrolase of the HAD superfamily
MRRYTPPQTDFDLGLFFLTSRDFLWLHSQLPFGMISAVLFDLDETLLDRTGSLKAFLSDQHARFRERLGKVDLETFCTTFLALDARGQVPKSTVYPALVEQIRGQGDLAPELLADYEERCCFHARGVDGMRRTLVALRERGLKLGIVTNGRTTFQARQIEALQLQILVDTILISENEGVRKPDRELFTRASDRLGVDPAACVFVGDNPIADILGANAAGMRTVWFANNLKWPTELLPNPGVTISKMCDLLMHLA